MFTIRDEYQSSVISALKIGIIAALVNIMNITIQTVQLDVGFGLGVRGVGVMGVKPVGGTYCWAGLRVWGKFLKIKYVRKLCCIFYAGGSGGGGGIQCPTHSKSATKQCK